MCFLCYLSFDFIPQTVRFGVLSWKKGTRLAGWVARASELGFAGPDAGALCVCRASVSGSGAHSLCQAPALPGPQRSLGSPLPALSVSGPRRLSRGHRRRESGGAQHRARHREGPAPTQRPPGPDTQSEKEPDIESGGRAPDTDSNRSFTKNHHSALPSMLK